ncbi:MAG: hypothetical protein SGILL_008149 [Bacillariaceae sp.]
MIFSQYATLALLATTAATVNAAGLRGGGDDGAIQGNLQEVSNAVVHRELKRTKRPIVRRQNGGRALSPNDVDTETSKAPESSLEDRFFQDHQSRKLYETCNVCVGDNVMTNESNNFQAEGSTFNCGKVNDLGTLGKLGSNLCAELQGMDELQQSCGCELAPAQEDTTPNAHNSNDGQLKWRVMIDKDECGSACGNDGSSWGVVDAQFYETSDCSADQFYTDLWHAVPDRHFESGHSGSNSVETIFDCNRLSGTGWQGKPNSNNEIYFGFTSHANLPADIQCVKIKQATSERNDFIQVQYFSESDNAWVTRLDHCYGNAYETVCV